MTHPSGIEPPAFRLVALGLWLGAALATATPCNGQDPTPPVPPEPRKLDEWPPLPPGDKDRVSGLLGQFRKADPALHAQAHEALVRIGDCAGPLLLTYLTDLPENSNDAVAAVLDQVLDRRHGALLAREAKKPRLALRRYAVRRLCGFVDPDLAPVLQTAAKDKDPDVAFHANLGLLALQDRAGLKPILQRARKEWNEMRAACAAVLPAARSPEVARWVLQEMQQGGPLEVVAGLRLLRSLAPRELASSIRGYLDAEDHGVKKEAVNALRALHGEEPLENLSVFQAIEMAKEWKARI